ncbi:hypothetical protein EYF80_002966 [Liparis tanakae]|uniref:Uncharacterized protein n=1 Tax=Liparis tanakae TaxID=230148 RepID=A0A4Z2JAL6_9TELE|nr:hypothetical protein EYF80_002966 [Liparis tanakae]
MSTHGATFSASTRDTWLSSNSGVNTSASSCSRRSEQLLEKPGGVKRDKVHLGRRVTQESAAPRTAELTFMAPLGSFFVLYRTSSKCCLTTLYDSVL